MLGNIADYQNRTVDLSIFHGIATGTGVPLTQQLIAPGAAGYVIAGITKLTQRFFIMLMTDLGSIPSEPTMGSSFMPDLLSGQLRTTAEISSGFYFALNQIRTAMLLEEDTDDPSDERFANAELLGVNLTRESVSLVIAVRSLAGESRQVILPILTRTV